MTEPKALCRQARSHGMRADWRHAPDLGAVLFSGRDAGSFLQTQLTSDVLALAPGSGQYSARLDRRGRLMAWFTLHRLPERGQPHPSYLALMPRSEVADLCADLSGAAITEDIACEDVGDLFAGTVCQGPAAAGDISGRDDLSVHEHGSGFRIVRSFTGDPGWIDLAHGSAEPADLPAVPAWPDDEHARRAWTWLTVEAGRPWPGRDYASGAVPLQQTGLEAETVSWTKGCYLGQEIVARIRSYGSVPAVLRGLEFPTSFTPSPDAWPAPGSALTAADGERRGSWSTAAWSATRERWIALAFLDRDHRAPGRELEVELADGATTGATVQLLPFHDGVDHGEAARRHHERAMDAFTHGRDTEAAELLAAAVRLDPERLEAHEALGVVLGRLERFHEAIGVFERLAEIAPGQPMTHTNLSLYYMKIGDREQAEHHKALATLSRFADPADAPDFDREAAAAERQRALGNLAMFDQVLEVDPDDALALGGRGRALLTLERWDEAAAALERALELDEANSALYPLHGRALEHQDRRDAAAKVYRRGIEVAGRRGDLVPLREMEHRLLLLEA